MVAVAYGCLPVEDACSNENQHIFEKLDNFEMAVAVVVVNAAAVGHSELAGVYSDMDDEEVPFSLKTMHIGSYL